MVWERKKQAEGVSEVFLQFSEMPPLSHGGIKDARFRIVKLDMYLRGTDGL